MLPTVSTIPACLDALVAAAKRALPGVQVVDGQPVEDIGGDLVCIAFTGEPGEASVEVSRERQQGATAPDRESYDIVSVAYAWAGDQHDPAVVRNRAFDLINRIAAEVAADQTLGGTVMAAWISATAYAPEQTRMGAAAYVRWTTHIEAFTGGV